MSTDKDVYKSRAIHSEAWQMRAMEGALSAAEERQWAAHLERCPACRQMSEAMAAVDHMLRTAPPPPLPADFTQATVARLRRQQQRQRWLVIFASVLIIAIGVWLGGSALTSALASLNRTAQILIAGRQALINALMQTLVGLMVSWRAFLPFVAALAGVAALWLMPNSILATLTVLWLSKHRHEMANYI
ncbi:MAG: anti-sigma factor family protein [Anaerolineales bacterium]